MKTQNLVCLCVLFFSFFSFVGGDCYINLTLFLFFFPFEMIPFSKFFFSKIHVLMFETFF